MYYGYTFLFLRLPLVAFAAAAAPALAAAGLGGHWVTGCCCVARAQAATCDDDGLRARREWSTGCRRRVGLSRRGSGSRAEEERRGEASEKRRNEREGRAREERI